LRQRTSASGGESTTNAGKESTGLVRLIGWLAGKAVHSHIKGDVDKTLHHTITAAAALANWHASVLGKTNMRPGIEPPREQPCSCGGGDHEPRAASCWLRSDRLLVRAADRARSRRHRQALTRRRRPGSPNCSGMGTDETGPAK